MSVTGGCLCGGVRYSISEKPQETGACHCNMCRKWSGGVYMGMAVSAGNLTLESEENLGLYKSSDWAERAFCTSCGSSLFYRVTAPGPHQGTCHVGMGTLDDASGVPLTAEIFVDEKPDGFAFAGDHATMTGAEVFALYAPPE